MPHSTPASLRSVALHKSCEVLFYGAKAAGKVHFLHCQPIKLPWAHNRDQIFKNLGRKTYGSFCICSPRKGRNFGRHLHTAYLRELRSPVLSGAVGGCGLGEERNRGIIDFPFAKNWVTRVCKKRKSAGKKRHM